MLQLQQSLEGHTERIWTLAWNCAGTVLATSGGDKSIRLWAQADGKWKCKSILNESHSKTIRRLCWFGQYLASASFDSTIAIWRSNSDGSWTTAVNLEGHESEVKSVAWSSSGQFLASCGRDKSVWIWERASAEEDQDDDDENAEVWDCSDVKNDHSKDVKHVVWHPSNNILASCSYDDTVKLFHKDGEDWKCFQTLSGHTSTVWSADFSASGEYLASCSDDKTVRIWKNHAHSKLPNIEVNSWKCVSVIQGYHSRTIYDVSWCKTSDLIASVSGDNSLAIYGRAADDPTTNETFVCLSKHSQIHDCDVNSVAWNPKSPHVLATASDDRTVKIWTYTPDDKGMKPLKVIDEIIQSLASASVAQDDNVKPDAQAPNYTINVTDHSHLLQIVKNLQILQDELYIDDDKLSLEKLFDLSICDQSRPIRITNLGMESNENPVKHFDMEVVGSSHNVEHRIRVVFDENSHFRPRIPRRSVNLVAVADGLFLFEKTGDLFKISTSGDATFLLGHLFSFTDVKFILSEDRSRIMYILSADRDEKIRITNYPNTFDIERFCFGHKHLLKSLYIVDSQRFASVDKENEACLWDLTALCTSSKHLQPIKRSGMCSRVAKRMCLDGEESRNKSARVLSTTV